jgi:hypothetical protein
MKVRGPRQQERRESGRQGAASYMFGKNPPNRETIDASLSPMGRKERKRRNKEKEE